MTGGATARREAGDRIEFTLTVSEGDGELHSDTDRLPIQGGA